MQEKSILQMGKEGEFYKNSVALFGVDLIVLGWHSWTLMGLDLNSDLVT